MAIADCAIASQYMKTKIFRPRRFLFGCGVVLLVLLGCCAFLRISNLSDIFAYYGMVKNPVPMVKDFALRRFDKGDAMSDLSQRYPKQQANEFGHFSVYGDNYWTNSSNYTSLEVVAKDGKLISAGASGLVDGSAWEFTFFHTTNDVEMSGQLNRKIEQYYNKQPSQLKTTGQP